MCVCTLGFVCVSEGRSEREAVNANVKERGSMYEGGKVKDSKRESGLFVM